MTPSAPSPTVVWMQPGELLPLGVDPWDEASPIPGLLAVGGDLSIASLAHAYGQGAFPWFGEGQPILWWSPNPRMVLRPTAFRLHRSLRKSWTRFLQTPDCAICMDTAFRSVVDACARTPRQGQSGTWIVDAMVDAYTELHRAGLAHSVEVFENGQLVGGLYCVNLGAMVFGESMFHTRTDASKWAVCALMGFCLFHGLPSVDCQQVTRHLQFLGAHPVARADFLAEIETLVSRPPPLWVWQQEPMVQALLQRSRE